MGLWAPNPITVQLLERENNDEQNANKKKKRLERHRTDLWALYVLSIPLAKERMHLPGQPADVWISTYQPFPSSS
jgi:hypothetical protein